MNFYIILISCMVLSSHGQKMFHHDLSEDDFHHYFGTRSPKEVPVYDLVHINADGTNAKYQEVKVSAFGEDFLLQLERNENLIADGCVVIFRSKNGTYTSQSCLNSGNSNCYYHGQSATHNESQVAVSTCKGLHGVVSLPDKELMIQPLRNIHAERVRRDLNIQKPHLVYKRSNGGHKCPYSNTEFKSVHMKRTRRNVKSRAKRSARRYMEMRVVVAPDSYKFHKEDTETFVTTIMNMAAKTFIDPSLGDSKVYMTMVEMTILREEPTDLTIVDDVGSLLPSFCNWQSKREPTAESNPKHSDGALLITKTDLQYKGDNSNVGLGNMEAMCLQQYKCSVNEDTGLETAYTIAHETGHTLGMNHDGDGNNCETGKYIMSANGGYGPTATQFSKCSIDALSRYLSSDKADCMTDVPGQSATNLYLSQNYPGILYSADTQCTLFYGTETEACDVTGGPKSRIQWIPFDVLDFIEKHFQPIPVNMTAIMVSNSHKECSQICREPPNGNKRRLCMETGSRRADGTECGHRKWCVQGQCVAMGSNAPRPINGGWSAYDVEWSPCSRPCGGGVKTKKRRCNNPTPRFGGAECQGESALAKLCNMQDCKISQHQFKDQQCSSVTNKPRGTESYTFVSFDTSSGVDQCKLKCRATQRNTIYTLGEQYEDGTECTHDSSFMSRCVGAKCKPFGCDGHLGSGLKFDSCGVCNGNGNTCSGHTGTFKQGKAKTFMTFLTVRKGSTGIEVNQKNKFCRMSVQVNGQRLFDENALTQTYTGSGVIVKYRKQPERIEITGPLPVDINLQVLQQWDDNYIGIKPDIDYKYYTPNGRHTQQNYKWVLSNGQCSKSCGTGKRVQLAKCVQISNNIEAGDYNCNIFQKPTERIVSCNTNACPPEWHNEGWGQCSKSCGGGIRTRLVQCVTIQGDSFTPVSESRCNSNRKPTPRQGCSTQACPGVWKPGTWSSCSTTCAYGVKTRNIRCYANQNSNTPISDSQCPANKPSTTEKCLTKPCDVHTTGSNCVDKLDCKAYGDTSICHGSFKSWAQGNCALYCGFCVKNPNEYSSDPNCRDNVQCDQYGDDVCTAYGAWSKENCKKHCNLCGTDNNYTHESVAYSTTASTRESCVDTEPCNEYADDICTDYVDWAKIHCARKCGFCGKTTPQVTHSVCADLESCDGFDANMCSQLVDWAKTNCARTCGFCDTTTTVAITSAQCADVASCSEYGDDICTEYTDWSKINCAKTCGLCQDLTSALTTSSACADVESCDQYGDDICTKYTDWSRANCARTCGFCGETTPLSTTQSVCVDLGSCDKFDEKTCTKYNDWSKTNCAKTCGFCGVSTTISTTRSGCVDLESCDDYGSNICSEYSDWSKINCAKTCGFCTIGSTQQTPTENSGNCKDNLDCSSYPDNTCKDYPEWSQKNCQKFCNLCGGSSESSSNHGSSVSSNNVDSTATSGGTSCQDKVNCNEYGKDICTAYSDWSRQNCVKHCNFCQSSTGTSSSSGGSSNNGQSTSTSSVQDSCQDKVNCNEYGDDVCTAYAGWAKTNCAKHCKICQPCSDAISDCSSYGNDVCTNAAYSAWAKQNCKKHCNLCGSRRKRAAPESPQVIPIPLQSPVKIIHANLDTAKKASPVPNHLNVDAQGEETDLKNLLDQSRVPDIPAVEEGPMPKPVAVDSEQIGNRGEADGVNKFMLPRESGSEKPVADSTLQSDLGPVMNEPEIPSIEKGPVPKPIDEESEQILRNPDQDEVMIPQEVESRQSDDIPHKLGQNERPDTPSDRVPTPVRKIGDGITNKKGLSETELILEELNELEKIVKGSKN